MSTPPFVMQHQQDSEVQEDKLKLLLQQQLLDIQANEGLNKNFPISRVKRMMKSDSERISAESPLLMAKACEAFILELTYRAGMNSQEANKNIVKPCDVAKAIMENDIFHFLNEVVDKYVPGYKQEENAGNSANGNQLNVGNYVEGNQVSDGNYFGGDQLNTGNIAEGNQLNFGNFVEGNQLSLENFIEGNHQNTGNFNEGNQLSVGNFIEGNQASLLHYDGFMGNPMMNMENDHLATNQLNIGHFIEENQASLPHVSGLMGNPTMGVDNDPVCPQPFMMQPPFTPSDQMPYHPK